MLDYLAGAGALRPLYAHPPTDAGLAAALEARRAAPGPDRAALVGALVRQYAGLPATPAVHEAIQALSDGSTFTVCTAHQPLLAGGPRYFAYKIIHAIRLAQHLAQQHPEARFVPVLYVGSEDHDLEEIGLFRYGGQEYRWDGAGQTGAVGRMAPTGIDKILERLFTVLGPPGRHTDALRAVLGAAYTDQPTVAGATRALVNYLFGAYGLVALDGDDPGLKQLFIPVMEEELLHGGAEALVAKAEAVLQAGGYAPQAHPRSINLFYLTEASRVRIERAGDGWTTADNTPRWADSAALLEELHAHPERFSPNVVLRPVYQETILPNVAFIGGGGEVAYWLQLKRVFDAASVPYPALVLRQSVHWAGGAEVKLRKRAGVETEAMFAAPEMLLSRRMAEGGEGPDLSEEQRALARLAEALKQKGAAADPTLAAAADSFAARAQAGLKRFGKKIFRAQKRRHADWFARVLRLHEAVRPTGSLQERTESFLDLYATQGPAAIKAILSATHPYGGQFVVLEEED